MESIPETNAWLTAATFNLVIFALVVLAIILVSAARAYWRPSQPSRRFDFDRAALPGQLIPESQFVDIAGARLHFVQAGRGPDLVLLHGIGASVFIWRFLFPLLQTHYRVTAFDIAGFGKSSKNPRDDYGLDAQAHRINEACEKIGIAKADLVGSSMGGAIALWMAKLKPSLYSRVIVMGPATDSAMVSPYFQKLARIAPVFRPTLTRRSMRLILGYVMARKELITDEVVDRYMEPFLGNGASFSTFISATSLLADRRLPLALQGLAASVLIIWGRRDAMVSKRSVERLIQALPHAELVVHEHGGHHIMEDEPDWIAQEIEKFLSRK